MLTVQHKPFLATLATAARAVLSNATIPILGCCRLRASGGRLSILATNMDLWIEGACDAEGKLDAVCPSAARLLAAVKAIGGGSIQLEERPSGLLLRHDSGRALLPLLPADEYPIGRELEGEVATIRVDGAEMARAIAMVVPSASTEQARSYLCGTCLRCDICGLTLLATDGHRLDRTRLAADLDGSLPPGGIIVPSQALSLLRGMTGSMVLTATRNLIRAEIDEMTVTSRLIDATYPDVDRVIPPADCSAGRFNARDLAAALERVSWAASDKAQIVGLRFMPGEPGRVWAWHSESPTEAIFACDADRELESGFNGRYVASLLDRLGEVEVEMHLGEVGFARFVASNSDDEHVVGATRIEPYHPTKELYDA